LYEFQWKEGQMSVKDADGHKLSLYPKEVSKVLDGDLDNSLLQVEIGVTDRCNHRCNYCSLDWVKREGNYVGRDRMLYALEDMAELGCRAVYFAGEGEPLLHKDFPEFVKKASELEMGVSMSSNGALLTRELSEELIPYLNWLRIGVDAATPETYSEVHGAPRKSFNKTIENIAYAAKVKKDTGSMVDIGVQSLLLPENMGEVVDLTRRIKKTGVDNLQIKPFAQHPFAKKRTNLVDYNDSKLHNLRERVEEFNDENFTVVYRGKSMERVSKPGEYTECLGLHFWTLLDAKGNVLPCNIFYGKPEFSFGNIHDERFKDIWKGEKRKEIIKNLNRSKCSEYICRADLLNRYMWRLKHPEPNDCFI